MKSAKINEIGNKIKPTHCFISPNLSLILAAHHLSIQININGFSFALLDLLNQEYIALEHFDIVVIMIHFVKN